ncbi:MurR/RpiR family transcriptional regulator [Halalkalibacter sp. APA_J-10(15)]|uniref:MurR/RpiR family transcriptional regulator n=1 Tax=Halalkalibacter sp. APA_J-10(15) TaxID=2933805 RepID=UPI001FF13904|nr:MurR/RpiR family transcriptional regulator [Halalkalibacter sp. APA_J-10(15)]MCK0472379.1 MurR/RpiR family transcriptional regulator [Halalkalibacter sp. APA_J-10(15)]
MDSKSNRYKPSIMMEQHKHSLTKSETKIYDYITSHIDQVLYYSLTELSEACDVAEATLLRFFRKLHFKGFQDFKFALAQEVSSKRTPNEENSTYIEKIRNYMVQAIHNSYDLIDALALEAAVKTIAQAHDVVIFGIGSSGIAANDMENRLLRIGKHIQAVTDPHTQVMRASSMTKETVVIAISVTGSTKDIVDTIQIAKAQGATIIAITNYLKSPLTKLANQVLLTSAKESPLDSGSLITKVAQLYLIDLICTGVTLENYEQSVEMKHQISENTAKKLY